MADAQTISLDDRLANSLLEKNREKFLDPKRLNMFGSFLDPSLSNSSLASLRPRRQSSSGSFNVSQSPRRNSVTQKRTSSAGEQGKRGPAPPSPSSIIQTMTEPLTPLLSPLPASEEPTPSEDLNVFSPRRSRKSSRPLPSSSSSSLSSVPSRITRSNSRTSLHEASVPSVSTSSSSSSSFSSASSSSSSSSSSLGKRSSDSGTTHDDLLLSHNSAASASNSESSASKGSATSVVPASPRSRKKLKTSGGNPSSSSSSLSDSSSASNSAALSLSSSFSSSSSALSSSSSSSHQSEDRMETTPTSREHTPNSVPENSSSTPTAGASSSASSFLPTSSATTTTVTEKMTSFVPSHAPHPSLNKDEREKLRREAVRLKHVGDAMIKDNDTSGSIQLYMESGLKFLEYASELEADGEGDRAFNVYQQNYQWCSNIFGRNQEHLSKQEKDAWQLLFSVSLLRGMSCKQDPIKRLKKEAQRQLEGHRESHASLSNSSHRDLSPSSATSPHPPPSSLNNSSSSLPGASSSFSSLPGASSSSLSAPPPPPPPLPSSSSAFWKDCYDVARCMETLFKLGHCAAPILDARACVDYIRNLLKYAGQGQ